MADAQYVIDIAANMSGGAQTSAQLDTLTKQLTSSGATADTVHDAIARLSNQLDAAASASTAAASALSAGQSEYAKLERAALQAAKAEEKAALSGVIPPEVAASAANASAAVSAYAVTLKALEAEADKTSAAEAALGKTLSNAKQLNTAAADALNTHTVSTRALARGLGELGGPLGTLGRTVLGPVRGFQALSEQLGSSNAIMAVAAIGTVAFVAALLAAAAAAVYATVKIAEWAIGLANTRRETALTREALEALDPALGKLSATVDTLSARTGLTAAAVDGIAESLQKAHVAAADMPAALEAASLSEAALGQGGAQQFLERMQASGKGVKAFSATVTSELGGVVSKKLLGITEQTAQFHKNISDLFGGLNIDGALTGLQRLIGLFDSASASGQAIKFLFTALFQPLIDNADKASTVIEAFVLGFEIGMVKLYITLKPTIKAISEFFGQNDPSLADTLAAVTKAGQYIAPVLALMAATFGVVLIAVGATVAIFVAAQFAVYALVAAVIYLGVELVEGVIGAWNSVTSFLKSINLTTIGHAIIEGLIAGITGSAGALVSSITGVVGGGIDAAKHLLGIHSPSKVFAEIGDNTVAGFAGGVDDAAPKAQSALESMVDSSSAAKSGAAAKPGPSANASSGGARRIDLTGANITFNGVKDAEQGVGMLEEMFTRLLEGDAAQASGGAPG